MTITCDLSCSPSYFIALKKYTLLIFCLMHPLVASGEKPKAIFSLTEIMPFKFEYNLNIDNI